MKDKSVIVFAPGHHERDQRVNRTINILSEIFGSVNIVYEARFSKYRLSSVSNNVAAFYVEGTRPLFNVLPRLSEFSKAININQINFDFIYIHDSGLVGLLLARKLRGRYGPSVRIIFDYHDFIPWEVSYQIGKVVKNGTLIRWIGFGVISTLRMYLSRIDSQFTLNAVVGISDAQILSLKKWLRLPVDLPSLSIPNTRPLLNSDSFDMVSNNQSGEIGFIWIGNIVEGRDLPVTIKYLDRLYKEFNFKFYIFGNVVSEKVFSDVNSKGYVRYMGPYKSDLDISKLSYSVNLIGLFFGWNDIFGTGINEISSPNKVFSYINLCLPVIIHRDVNNAGFAVDGNIGKTFRTYEDFRQCYIGISNEYNLYKLLVIENRSKYLWESDLNDLLYYFILDIYKG